MNIGKDRARSWMILLSSEEVNSDLIARCNKNIKIILENEIRMKRTLVACFILGQRVGFLKNGKNFFFNFHL